MIIIAAGLPCALYEWGSLAFRHINKRSGLRFPLQSVRVHEDLEAPENGNAIFFSQTPNDALARLARDPNTRVVVFSQDGVSSVDFVINQSNLPFLTALRQVSLSAALIQSNLVQTCRPVDIHDVDPEQSRDMIDWIGKLLGASLSPSDIDFVLDKTGPAPNPNTSPSASIGAAEIQIIEQVLGPSCDHLCAQGQQSVTWPHNVLTRQPVKEVEQITAPEMAIDLTGPSRIVLTGPHFHLARGKWAGSVVIGFTKDAGGTPLSLTLWHPSKEPETLKKVNFKPDAGGVYGFSFTFDVTEPHKPIEALLRSERGAIDGRFALAKIEFSPLETIGHDGQVMTRAVP